MKFFMCLFLFFVSFLGFSDSENDGSENKACFTVNGMTCSSCSVTVKSAVRQLKGIKGIVVSVDNSDAIVLFDKKLTTIKDIIFKINAIGGEFRASEKQCKA